MRRSPIKLFPQDVCVGSRAFLVTRTWRPASFSLPSHTHEHTNLALCVSGSYEESLAGKWLRATPASLICRPGGVPHANNYGRGASRAIIFEVPAKTLEAVSVFSRVLDEPLHVDDPEVAGFARRADEKLTVADDVSPLALEGLAYELIAFAARRESSYADEGALWLRRVKDFVDEEFRRAWTMEDLACIAGVHAAHLARTFRKRFGRTVGTYVRERRLTHAARLLRESALPLTDISAESGFYDQSHFTRAFTRRFGVSPARYRRIVRM